MSYVRGDNIEVERLVSPLGLVLKAGNWYLVGLTGRDGTQHRVYRVSRVRSLDVLDETFSRPRGFDLGEFWVEWLRDLDWGTDPYPVQLRLDAALAADLPRFAGEGVRALVLDAPVGADGRLSLELTFESRWDAVVSLLPLGAGAEVLAPADLRTELARVAAEMVALYGAAG
jgi:predicted DNA-binding transcriptional regulator YafY